MRQRSATTPLSWGSGTQLARTITGICLFATLVLTGCAGSTSVPPPVDLVIHRAQLYTAPDAPPQPNTTLVVDNGLIREIRPSKPTDANLPAATTIDAAGRALTAGLWNAHVHFTNPELATQPQAIITDMLLRYGFTNVVDTGSVLAQTLGLRSAIQAGKLRGPQIALANGSFVFKDGTPSYLPGIRLPEVESADSAAPLVNSVLDAGADGIKIFSGSFITPERTIYLPPDIIATISSAAHARDSFVMAHPTTVEGLANAVRGGVDVIAHTTAPQISIPPDIIRQMRSQDTALIPTLSLWRNEMLKFGQSKAQADFMENAAVQQLRNLHQAGITILFGTDVGYMPQFDTTPEYVLMHKAGMDWPAIHASLTTRPAQRFGRFTDAAATTRASAGKVEIGAAANLVLFNGDPATDIRVLGNVAATIVQGRLLFTGPEKNL